MEPKPAHSVSLQITPSGVQELEKSLDSGPCYAAGRWGTPPGLHSPLLALSLQPAVPQGTRMGFM